MIKAHGLVAAWPHVRARFAACRAALVTLREGEPDPNERWGSEPASARERYGPSCLDTCIEGGVQRKDGKCCSCTGRDFGDLASSFLGVCGNL
ncbi:MAG: hypothetical protein JWN73_3572 [Betaproteobacteria bacterium]|nr:hypothetical protein [Betaproteobacteria bacterium]